MRNKRQRGLYNKILFFVLGPLLFCLCLFCTDVPHVLADPTPGDDVEWEVTPQPEGVSDDPEQPAEGQPIVIVIDPGHGGEEEGGMYDSFVEKDMTLITAQVMKTELEKYENVKVYLTRPGDTKLSLDDRVAYAKSVDADFLFCLHYNLSADHNTLFGAECWVSAFERYYSEGYAFASIEMEALEKLGLYSRGIKTRLNKEDLDYYGIIRHAREQELTCVLIEHCHMDHENDRPYCEGREQWEAFGRLDAESAAKYFRLKSDILGVDYRDYHVPEVPVPTGVMRPDSTEPDICMIDLVEQEMETGAVTVELSAVDYDSGMLYYDYSYDGGETFFPRLAWEDQSADTITFTMQVPPHIVPQLVVRGYNGYDLYTESNLLTLPSMDYKTEEELAAEQAREEELAAAAKAEEEARRKELEASPAQKNYVEIRRDIEQEEVKQPSVGYFLTVCLVCALLVIGMALSVALILRSGKKRRRRRRRKRR